MTARSSQEESWCKNELRPILEALPNVRDVRYRHGSREHGKDFTFELTGPDGEDIHCAIQAKFGDISGAARELATIKAQVEEAFTTPYENTPGNKRWVDLVYVACSGEFKDVAVESLREQVRDARGNRIRFLGGSEIKKWKQRALARQRETRAEVTRLLSRALLEVKRADELLKLLAEGGSLPYAVSINVTRSVAEAREVSDDTLEAIDSLIVVVDNYNSVAPLVQVVRAIGIGNLPEQVLKLRGVVAQQLQKVREALERDLAAVRESDL